MKHTDLVSSNLASCGWEEDGCLEVKFKNGSLYRYSNVPERVFKELTTADSAGKYFGRYIRGVYRGARAEEAGESSGR